jgi:hypothetical protein
MQRARCNPHATLSTSNQYSNISDENIFQRNCSTRYRKSWWMLVVSLAHATCKRLHLLIWVWNHRLWW